MQLDTALIQKILSKDLMDVVIRVSLVAFLVVMCVRVFAPFAGLMLWALILAVALYPLHQGLAKRLGGRQGRTATLLVLAGLLLIGVPTVMLGSSFAGHIHGTYSAFENNTITIKQPAPAVADWPLIGDKIYGAWSAAADDLPAFLEKMQPQLGNISKKALSLAANTAGGVLAFLGSLIIAGIMMAYGKSGSAAMKRILSRLIGPSRGSKLHGLSTATIRSVATGVIGVAFIQALLLAGFADNVLKPMLLGRGVDAPMPVILLGALGGMVSGGIIGLFVGAVLLAVGYEVFMEWVDQGDESAIPDSGQTDIGTPATTVSE